MVMRVARRREENPPIGGFLFAHYVRIPRPELNDIKTLSWGPAGFLRLRKKAWLSWQQEHLDYCYTTARACRHTIPGPGPGVGQHRRGAQACGVR
jgi:hypothetical protein